MNRILKLWSVDPLAETKAMVMAGEQEESDDVRYPSPTPILEDIEGRSKR